MSEPLPTLEIPATSAEYFGVPIWAKDDTAPVDVTTMTPRLAIIAPDVNGDYADPIESDWVEGVWHKRNGDWYADVLNANDVRPQSGTTYAIFAQAKGTDEAPYRQVGWLRAS